MKKEERNKENAELNQISIKLLNLIKIKNDNSRAIRKATVHVLLNFDSAV